MSGLLAPYKGVRNPIIERTYKWKVVKKKSIRKELSRLTRNQISKWYLDIDSAETSDAKMDYIIDKVMRLVGISTIPIATHRLYRCRSFQNDIVKVESIFELLQPPSSVAGEGRCNLKKRPVLYVTDNANSLVAECGLSVGQKFCLVQFDHLANVKEDLNCVLLGIKPHHAIPNDPDVEKIKEFWVNFYGSEYDKYKLLTTLIHKSFVRSGKDGRNIYKFTARLCDKVYNSGSNIDAIFYPSIANNGACRNYAIRPEVIRKSYCYSKVVLCELDGDYKFTWLDGGEIDEGGKIIWGKSVFLDYPVAVGVSKKDLNDPSLYIHPRKI